eukprot:tig00000912_g5439.t1
MSLSFVAAKHAATSREYSTAAQYSAQEYLANKGAQELLAAITSELVLRRPVNPVIFLTEFLTAGGNMKAVVRDEENDVMEGFEEYMSHHRLHQFFEEFIRDILQHRPDDIKQAFIKLLSKR